MQLKIGFQSKTLTLRKHYEPLKYLLENDFFHEDARECILNILSVLEVRKVQTKASAKHEKSSKTPQNFLTGQKSLFDIFQAKKSEDEKVVEESDNLKNVAVLHDSSEESCGDDSACSDSEVVKVIAKTESDLVLSPCETKHHV